MISTDSYDEPGDPIAALADEIAERLALRFGMRLTEQMSSSEPDREPGLWTARRVAAHYGVGVSFVYQHANELGCVRLGGGTCPRLRFDPTVVHAHWPSVGGAPSEGRRPRRSKSRRRTGSKPRDGYELLDFDREP
jgi:hypothetical protein